jgi:ABC-type antimicrobial peptide transport system permease subunit
LKLTAYVWNNITQKKIRTAFYLIGIIVSVTSAADMRLFVGYYSEQVDDFFQPFAEYDQILERGTNFFQLVPVGSKIDSSLQPEIEAHFDSPVFSALFITRTEDLLSIEYRYFMGLHPADMEFLWRNLGLETGRYPSSSNECVVGNAFGYLDNITYYNQTFEVVGVLNQAFDYTDKFVVVNLNILQIITGNVDRVNVFYISKNVESNYDRIISFEQAHPGLDFITQEEISQVNGEVDVYTSKISLVLTVFTGISALVFVFTLGLLSIYNRKRDFDLFYILGTPKKQIIFILLIENLFFLVGGALIGIPVSLVIYGIIYAYLRTSIYHEVGLIDSFSTGLRKLFSAFPTGEFFGIIGIITSLNLVMAALVMTFGLKKYNLGYLKEKF